MIIDHGKHTITYSQTLYLQFQGTVTEEDFKMYLYRQNGYLAYVNSDNETYAGRSAGSAGAYTVVEIPDVNSITGEVGIVSFNRLSSSSADFYVSKGDAIFRYDTESTVVNSDPRGDPVYSGPVESLNKMDPSGMWDRFAVQFDRDTGDTLARTEFSELSTLRYRVLIPTDSGHYLFGLNQANGPTDPGPLYIYKITMPDVDTSTDGTCTLIHTGTTDFVGLQNYGPRVYPIVESGNTVSKFLVLCQTATPDSTTAMIFDMDGDIVSSESDLKISIPTIFDSSRSWRTQSAGTPGFKEGAIYIKGTEDLSSSCVWIYKYVIATGEFHGYQVVANDGSMPEPSSVPPMQQHYSEDSNPSILIEFGSLGLVNSEINVFNTVLFPYTEPEPDDSIIQTVAYY